MTIRAEDLLDREQLKEVIYLYCRGVDRQDWDLVRSCFTDDAYHNHRTLVGGNDVFIKSASSVISQADGTLHTVGNVLIELDGDTASSEATFVAYHRIKAGREGLLETQTRDRDWIVAGRYVDKWRKTQSGWKIFERQAVHDWVRWDDATDGLISKPE